MLTDYNMPDCTGFELLKKIKSNPEITKVPVVFLTTESQIRIKCAAAKEAGLSAWIKKPYRSETFFAQIENAIAMDNNQKRFVEDALDLLNELDEGLLQLEANPQATAPLEQVFRTMHTIKGGANMFGFENIGELAHHLETCMILCVREKCKSATG